MSNFVHTKVDPNRLSTAADNIENSLSVLENAFKAVEDALLTTLQPTWSGPACDMFYQQYALDVQTFSSHTRALRSVNGRLKEAAGIYDKADNKAGEMVRNLKME